MHNRGPILLAVVLVCWGVTTFRLYQAEDELVQLRAYQVDTGAQLWEVEQELRGCKLALESKRRANDKLVYALARTIPPRLQEVYALMTTKGSRSVWYTGQSDGEPHPGREAYLDTFNHWAHQENDLRPSLD